MVVNLSQSLLLVAFPKEVCWSTLICHLYKCHMPDSVESNEYLFSDDAKIYKSISSLNDHDILQHVIDNLTKWSSDCLLTFNPDKCKVLKVVTNTFNDYDYVM